MAFGPPIVLLCLAFLLKPDWLKDVDTWGLFFLGIVIGAVGAFMVRAIEPQD